jgi:hypothetical protein
LKQSGFLHLRDRFGLIASYMYVAWSFQERVWDSFLLDSVLCYFGRHRPLANESAYLVWSSIAQTQLFVYLGFQPDLCRKGGTATGFGWVLVSGPLSARFKLLIFTLRKRCT